MWPMLLNLTHDECRRTLRRLELEAYANMISVFRAQGALEDNRKKLLEELRAVLHISSDRHSAEARRVSNDELLATIAHHLTGPNTGLGWISEGRRRVPLMPRGIPQTAYTEIADKTAEAIKEENKEILKNLEAEKLIAPKSSEEELPDPEGETAESVLPSNDMMEEMLYPPVAMEDQTSKLWETELINRKRKIPEGGSIPDECTLPTKNMRNIPVNTNQKHLNLSQIYSKYTQPATSKSSGQSKHSYNQVSKVSTSKSSQPHQPRSHKHRSHRQNKNAAQIVLSKEAVQPGTQIEYAGPPGSFQASYTQSILGGKTKPNYMDDMKPKVLSSPGMVTESPTLQLLAQPAAVPHELRAPSSPDDPGAPPHTTVPPLPKHARHPHHVLVKGRRPDQPTDKKVVVAPGSTQKALNAPGKVVTTKVIGSGPRPPPAPAPASAPLPDKMIIVSKPQSEHKI
ncbi:hypothetical protein MSG28_002446 [Choristoneura fumiferana]|uniref:Uncharacterized protein n=1 Tax=Choristoneura fumiferana TaxID=7141 RepID=A0ACC0JVS3_CHOFU|nr:hypothetical protein MSG28_002446 [Choristoneura fumiferana]